ncbi:MAG: patatin-like phospholipase family protein [Myxococcales bacterium]|nr:patatin-like phospholipase family protein [Myxococcales bacterium]
MTRARIGLALGSGAARGWAHIGVLEGLKAVGLEPDIVCGTSMGALVGGAYAAGCFPALQDWARALTWRIAVRLLDVRLSGGGLIDGGEIVTLLEKLGITCDMEQTNKPFAAVATSLVTGREIWLRSGSLSGAVRASIGIPGIFKPVKDGDDWLIDGGLVNPVPVSLCRALGAEIIIAVNLNSDLVGRRFEITNMPRQDGAGGLMSPELVGRLLEQVPKAWRDQAAQIAPRLLPAQSVVPAYFDVLANALNIMEDQITRTRLAGEPPHVLLAPRLGHIGPFEFHRAEEAIAEGRASVEQAMPYLRRYL